MTVLADLKELQIEKTLDEIKQMSKFQFSNLLKLRSKENAFKYLIGKQKNKGSEMKYLNLEMSEYLMPINETLTIEQKQLNVISKIIYQIL